MDLSKRKKEFSNKHFAQGVYFIYLSGVENLKKRKIGRKEEGVRYESGGEKREEKEKKEAKEDEKREEKKKKKSG